MSYIYGSNQICEVIRLLPVFADKRRRFLIRLPKRSGPFPRIIRRLTA